MKYGMVKIFMDLVYIIGFLFVIIYEVLYAWCLRYNIYIARFFDIRISTC